jgi:uncharacterized membrane protein
MLGTFWLAQHALLGIFGRCDRTLTWINLGFLFVVSLLPFSAALLAHYVHVRLAVGVYWLNILLLGVALEAGARYGRNAFVPGDDPRAHARLSTFRRRILLAQSLYALAALICLISTQVSVIALLLSSCTSSSPPASGRRAKAPRRHGCYLTRARCPRSLPGETCWWRVLARAFRYG